MSMALEFDINDRFDWEIAASFYGAVHRLINWRDLDSDSRKEWQPDENINFDWKTFEENECRRFASNIFRSWQSDTSSIHIDFKAIIPSKDRNRKVSPSMAFFCISCYEKDQKDQRDALKRNVFRHEASKCNHKNCNIVSIPKFSCEVVKSCLIAEINDFFAQGRSESDIEQILKKPKITDMV